MIQLQMWLFHRHVKYIIISNRNIPHIFVSTVSNKVKRWEVCVNCEQVKTEQHDKNFNDDPNQSCACTQTQNLWTEPEHVEKT